MKKYEVRTIEIVREPFDITWYFKNSTMPWGPQEFADTSKILTDLDSTGIY